MSDHPTLHLSVEAAYDRWAGLYDDYDNPMLFVAGHAVASLAPLAAGGSVFEFGCGTGRNLALLKHLGAERLSGCDLSKGMLAQARRRDPAFTLIRHDMEQPLPAAAATGADLVLFCLALEHVGDLRPPLAQARRLLRPGGRVAIVEIHPLLATGGVAAHFVAEGMEVRMPVAAHGFDEYRDAFAETGLVPLQCRDWCPRDLPPPLPFKVGRRGPDVPLAVQFILGGRTTENG